MDMFSALSYSFSKGTCSRSLCREKCGDFKNDSAVQVSMKTAIFEVECVLPCYIQALGNYRNDTHVKRPSQTSVVAIDCHFCVVG